MQNFKVKFKGVRGSYPVPRTNFLKYGGNTSCVEVNVGGRLIILDAGTGIIELGRELVQNHILSGTTMQERKPVVCALFLSHIHQDHIQGLPFFNPAYILSTKLNIFGMSAGKKSLKETLAEILFDKVFPLGLEDVNCNLEIEDFGEKQAVIIDKNGDTRLIKLVDLENTKLDKEDIVITSHKTFAHPKEGSLCFKITYQGKSLVFATDKESYVGSDKKFIEFAHDCDLLIHDAQYTHQEYVSPIFPKQGFGHSTYQMAMESAKLAHAKKLAFFHYDPNYDDDVLAMLENELCKENENYYFAKEGLEIVL